MMKLMIELAEPLLEIAGEKAKKELVVEGKTIRVENCELHFIRCIKPNEDKTENYFVDAMSLQ
jgi:myosin heavy subunit